MAHPNQALRAARSALPSGANTQQAVADAVCDIIQERSGRRPPVDADYVGKLERGLIHWPNKEYRSAFRLLFGADADAELGFYSTRAEAALVHDVLGQGESRDLVDDATIARELVRFTGLAVFGSLPAQVPDILSGMHVRGGTPERIGLDDVRYIERTTDLFESWDFAFGGGLSRNAVIGQLEWTHAVHNNASTTPAVRAALQSAISRLAEVAGWMSFDAGDSPTARRCWLLGLHMASEVRDWPNRTNILMDMAREAVYRHRPEDAVSLMGMARTWDTEVTATIRTAMHVVTARAHGAMGLEDECLRQIGQARECFADRNPTEDPPWIAYYDEAQLAGDCGHALFPLAARGVRVGETIDLLRHATRTHGPAAARSSALSRSKLARLHLLYTDPVEAAAEAAPVLRAASGIRSARLVDDLRSLHRDASDRATNPAAASLRRDVRAVLRAVA
ncbi:hypothetical protein [Nocardiopsis tropica]|uniref:XRE family transcriptional regulator n=1 Tax=Nocardiopsis tropica TaxID=109330 RepID=A0ABU7KPN7_9ACTN|nr:hypothetical protein [Nocardiopsis umidischolae]MEE2050652.1 hypothetical protein [Nocardiopsis umidischolae]